MKNLNKRTISAFFVMLIVFCATSAVAFATGGDEGAVSNFYATFWALVPPFVAIALALITKEVYSSLFIGIVLGGLFSANMHPIVALDNVLNEGIIAAVSGTAGIFIFLVILGALVALVNKAGGSYAM